MAIAKDIGIDLGTASVLVYVKGKGVVLNEPSVVAMDKTTGKLLKVGTDAQAMLGRTPGNIIAIRPLREGVISDYDMTERMLKEFIHKVAGFCNVKLDCVIENLTLPILYEAPLYLEERGLSSVVCRELHLPAPEPDLWEWRAMVSAIKNRSKSVTIGLVGKYVQLHDAYLSVAEALRHAGFFLDAKVSIRWIDSELVTAETVESTLAGLDGILVPGGFGSRGIEGMILAAQYAREKNIPYFGICLGMQVAVIEYARHVLGIADASSGEFAPEGLHKVIDYMPGQSDAVDKGGTLRLGSYPCFIRPGTTMERCYGVGEISERHRHRYEFNNEFRQEMQDAGLVISGTSPDGRLVETVELPGRDFHLGAQFHPEFKSRPNRAHPLFKAFIAAALKFRASEQRSLLHM